MRKFLLNNCLIFKQITGFDVVTDLFFKIYDQNGKKSCNSCRVDSNWVQLHTFSWIRKSTDQKKAPVFDDNGFFLASSVDLLVTESTMYSNIMRWIQWIDKSYSRLVYAKKCDSV